MNKLLFIFPGQGSQYKGMGKDMFLEIPVVRETYEKASDILNYDLAQLSFDDTEDKLFLTRYTQPALLTHSIACLKSFEIESNGLYSAQITAGHSLGEYSALVAANCLTFETALKLVQKRGELMGKYGTGEMLALPLSQDIAETLATKHYCGISACNLPEQTVVGGLPSDLDKLVTELRETHPRIKPTRLATEGAFHTYYMIEAAIKFRPFLESTNFQLAKCNVASNFSGVFHENNAQAMRLNLFNQLFHAVRWHENLLNALRTDITHVIEFGGGIGKGSLPSDKKPNLASIIKRIFKKTDNPAQYHAVINLESLQTTINQLNNDKSVP
ncbi:MAG: hypothetical protein CL402_02320 [Acidiferrobacteraceae bacterium]|nr:hypothetical protein [Acidiferrobacteraceae bacterium]|tara:strand:- start:53796 stop:54782 length:987 start_codon:yes stop_codon:yes gene_type:complete